MNNHCSQYQQVRVQNSVLTVTSVYTETEILTITLRITETM